MTQLAKPSAYDTNISYRDWSVSYAALHIQLPDNVPGEAPEKSPGG